MMFGFLGCCAPGELFVSATVAVVISTASASDDSSSVATERKRAMILMKRPSLERPGRAIRERSVDRDACIGFAAEKRLVDERVESVRDGHIRLEHA